MNIGENIIQYNFPTTIRFGKNASLELGPHLKTLNKKRPLIVSDKAIIGLPFFKSLIDSLKENGLDPFVFSEIDKNPIKKNVLLGTDTFKKNSCDSIVGLGGGASMDVARAIALKANHERDLFDFDDSLGGDRYVTEEIPYFITIPTTSGTGSEVGRSTVIADNETHEKKVLFSPKLMPKIVFADPWLTMKLPSQITAATGMDALTHNLEALFSKGFSPLCDGIALEGIKLVFQSLETATLNPDLESRSKMMMAALMGATAFQKGLGIVHSLAHPLSTLYDMHHGLANAIMMNFGVRFNAEVCEDKIKEICQTIGIQPSVECFLSHLENLNRTLGLPTNLVEANLGSIDVEKLADLAIKDVCHFCNPKEVTREDFLTIYKEATKC